MKIIIGKRNNWTQSGVLKHGFLKQIASRDTGESPQNGNLDFRSPMTLIIGKRNKLDPLGSAHSAYTVPFGRIKVFWEKKTLGDYQLKIETSIFVHRMIIIIRKRNQMDHLASGVFSHFLLRDKGL